MDNQLFNEFLEEWHEVVATGDQNRLDLLLADDVVFYSPVVFSPQRGRTLTTMYLLGASMALKDGFVYKKQIINGLNGVLEFKCEIDGITVEGVDIIELNKEGKVVSFKVMVRPLKAMQKVHEKMGELLQMMKG